MPDPFDKGADGDPIASIATPERHGRAALLLVESLIHGLISRSALSVREAIEIIEAAADIERELLLDPTRAKLPISPSTTLLRPLANSLRYDLKD